MIEEFRVFITRGNLITLAVGFIMGVAFSALTTSFVEDLIMPIVAIPFGEPDFTSLQVVVNGSEVRYGAFLTSAVAFLLTAAAVFFFVVKPYNAFERRQADEEEAKPSGPSEIELLTQIRDSLRSS